MNVGLLVSILIFKSMSLSLLTRPICSQRLLNINSWFSFLDRQCSRNMKTKLDEWSFSQPSLLSQFKFDSVEENYVRRVPKAVFSPVKPTPLETDLQLVSASENCLRDILDLDPIVLKDEQFAKFVTGNILLPGSQPVAHRYGGFMFINVFRHLFSLKNAILLCINFVHQFNNYFQMVSN